MSKSNKGLRDMVARMERERIVLEGRAKAFRGADRAGQQASQEAARERDRLREELEAVKHERLMNEGQGVETLRLRNKLLQVWLLGYFSCYGRVSNMGLWYNHDKRLTVRLTWMS